MTRELTARDHTLAMQALLDRPLNVLHYLERTPDTPPSQRQALEAALQVRAFSPEVHDIFVAAYDLLPAFEAAQAALSPQEVAQIDALVAEVTAADSPADAADLTAGARERFSEHRVGLEVAAEILRDGASTIYSPDYPPAEYLASPVYRSSTAGAAIGAADISGAIVGGLGAGPAGAAGGALIASTTGALTALVIESAS